ncbi:hypothetical protein I4U23_016047 [Adineta vaga]|nr:hypothetical protein I4U23_016047 [Adineta vaga]
MLLLKKNLVELNLFNDNSDNERLTLDQRIAIRIYLLILIIVLIILNFYSSLSREIHRETIQTPNYKGNAGAQFQMLAVFCQQAKQIIDDALQLFLQDNIVTSQVLPPVIFDLQMNGLIRDWQLETIKSFNRTFQLIRTTQQGNQLANAYFNFKLNLSDTGEIIPHPLTYFNDRTNSTFNCAISKSCGTLMAFYDFNLFPYNFTRLDTIPNFHTSCIPVQALRESLLECFYNQACMDKIARYIALGNYSFTIMNSSKNQIDEIIESIVNRLFVDKWSSNLSFYSYYKTCSPQTCTFEYNRRHDILFLIPTILSVFDGLTTGLTIVINILLKIIRKLRINHSFFERLHAVKILCRSSFVSDQWIEAIFSHQNFTQFDLVDFRSTSSAFFQLLSSLCQLSEETVNDGLSQLKATEFSNAYILSAVTFNDQIQSFISQFQVSMTNALLNTLHLVRRITSDNTLMTLSGTNWQWKKMTNDTLQGDATVRTKPTHYGTCDCGLSSPCIQPAIVAKNDTIRGLYVGCYPLEALLKSSLQCFFDSSCFQRIQLQNISFNPLNSSIASRFLQNASIESLISQLMVEEWSRSIFYERYFNECYPLSCNYSYFRHRDLIDVLTSIIGLYGGLVVLVKVIVHILLELYKSFKRQTTRIEPITH